MAIISFTTQFDLSLSPQRMIFTDTSDYAGQGISTADVNGSFRIVAPDGSTIYNNTDFTNALCDIDVAASLISQQLISFTPVLGTYTIIYTVDDTNASLQYTVTNTYNNQYVAPVVDITQVVDCITPIFSQVDDTDYVVAGITPTKTLTNKLVYPVGSAGDGSPVITTTSTLSTKTFYPGAQQSEIVSTLSYTFTDGLLVTDVVTGVKTKIVDCTFICSVLCCMVTQERLKESYRGNNEVKFNEQLKIFTEVQSYVSLINTNITCGNGANTDTSDYVTLIGILLNCTSDCKCDDVSASRVVGFGSIIGLDGTDGTNGADGSNGTNGTDGIAVIFDSITVDTPSTGAFSSLKSFTLPINSLTQDGDSLIVHYTLQAVGTVDTKVKLMVAGVTAQPKLAANDMRMYGANTYLSVDAIITRRSATTIHVDFDSASSDETTFDAQGAYTFDEPSITVSNLTTNTNLIDIQGFTSGSDTIVCKHLMITKLLK